MPRNKRSTKKARRKRKSSKPSGGPVREVLDYGPIKLFRDGLYVGFQADREHPGYEAYRASQQKQADELPETLLKMRSNLAAAAAPFHAFDVIFAVWATYGMV